MAKADNTDPSETSDAHKTMAPRLAKMRALLGGTEAMREAGREYLPQHDAEKTTAYAERLQRTTLYNVTEMTLTSWVGSVFGNPVLIDPALDTQISDLFEDIDLEGNALPVFGREWFRDGLAFAVAPMLVLSPLFDDAPRTLKDDENAQIRPFWRRLAPENVLHVRTGTAPDGREVVTHLRVQDMRIESDGFLDVLVPQILVYTDTDFSVYEERKMRNGKVKWVQTAPPTLHGFGEVPLVVYYAEKECLMVGKTAITDLADLNIQHWQSTSDQINCLTVARFPILAGTGVNPDTQIDVGPRKYMQSEDPQARFFYVEHSGAALSAGEADLKSIEARMANYGAEYLKRRPGRETATARALDSAESSAQIEDAAARFNDALDLALYFTAKWMGVEPPKTGAVIVQAEVEEEEEDAQGEPVNTPG